MYFVRNKVGAYLYEKVLNKHRVFLKLTLAGMSFALDQQSNMWNIMDYWLH